MTYFYLKVDGNGNVQACSALTGPINVAGWVQVSEEQYDAANAGTLTKL